MDEIKAISNLIEALGESGKIAFIWYLVFTYAVHPFMWVLGFSVGCFSGVRAIKYLANIK